MFTNYERIMSCKGLVHTFYTDEDLMIRVYHSLDKDTFLYDVIHKECGKIIYNSSDMEYLNELTLL